MKEEIVKEMKININKIKIQCNILCYILREMESLVDSQDCDEIEFRSLFECSQGNIKMIAGDIDVMSLELGSLCPSNFINYKRSQQPNCS
jgi:hypothetical protein